ncbi:MAG TPA: TolC family protein [Fluviicola sp.]|nr:TolC family protein [Fluviicola sp.]
MRFYLFFIIACVSGTAAAQNILSFEQAVQRTLANNFDILIVRNTAEQIANENNIGNAGYLPQIGINADQFWGSSDTRQEFYSGQINNKKGAKSSSFNANIRLDWTFFDGFAMFARDKRLQLQEDAATLSVNAQAEMALYQTAVLYYSIVYQQQMGVIYEQALQLSRERFRLVETRRSSGAANDLQYYQAKLDLAADSSNLLMHRKTIRDLKTELATVMGSASDVNFEVDPGIPVMPTIDKTAIAAKAQQQNTSLLINKSNIAILDQQRKEVQSRYYPQLSLYTQYSYASSQSQVGLLSSNRSMGPGIGLTLRWNILDRLTTFTELKNTGLQQENAQLQFDRQTQLVSKEMQLAFDNYDYAQQLSVLENNAVVDAEEIFRIAEIAYTSGSITDLALREIQFSIIQTKTRQFSASLAMQTAIFDLFLLSGDFKGLL